MTIEGAVNGAALTLFIPRNRGAAEAGNPRGTRRALPSDRRPHRAGEKQGMGGRGWRGAGLGRGRGVATATAVCVCWRGRGRSAVTEQRLICFTKPFVGLFFSFFFLKNAR